MGRKYALGDEILRCKTPFAYVVNQEIVKTICDQCLKRTSIDENSGLQELGNLEVLFFKLLEI